MPLEDVDVALEELLEEADALEPLEVVVEPELEVDDVAEPPAP